MVMRNSKLFTLLCKFIQALLQIYLDGDLSVFETLSQPDTGRKKRDHN